MKHFIFVTFFILLFFNAIDAQTNANISGPENVLVVYNSNSDTSIMVKNYYVNARGIPTSNIVPLNSLIGHNITVNGSTHSVSLAEGGNIIRDSVNHLNGTWYASPHAWKYFYQYIALPIKEYLINNNLTSTIRYIVLCKGLPYKIQAGADSGSVICNQSIDGLLCMLNTNNYDILLDSVYNNYRRFAVSGSNYCYSCQISSLYNPITNPYYSNNSSSNLDMTNRFKGNVFTRNWYGHIIKLDYLVSHLDGISYNMIEGMIDKSVLAINSNNYDWFIDADPNPCHGGSIMVDFADSTTAILNSIGFLNYSFNTDNDTVTYHNKPIMSYSSNGVHTTKPPLTGEGQTLHPDYIQSQLNFNYAPGAIFNTAESYNAELLSSIHRHSGAEMGQIVEFFSEGGTLGVGHAYEPLTGGVIRDGVMFPAYQVGYSFIDAAYLGMPYLAWQNVIVGDPLTTIAWGKQTLTSDLNWSGTNLVTGEIFISTDKILTIEDDSYIDLRHQGFITGHGVIVAGQNITFNVYDWKKALFLSYDSEHPRLIWGAHPDKEGTVFYNVMRKINQDNWTLVAQTTDLEYTDTEISLVGPLPVRPETFYKVLAYNEYPVLDTSNTVSTWTDKGQGKILAENIEGKKYSFTLEQNYPNPFNPTTQINYSIKEAGLVQLRVYDILGKEIVTLVNTNKEAGYYSVDFDASELPSGVYIYQLTTPGFTQARKMILTK